MPIRNVPGTNQRYHLIAFDAEGRERADDPEGAVSQLAAAVLRQEPITDVFLFSHGWRGDLASAEAQYDQWTSTMAAAAADLAELRQRRPGFRPLLIGLHWPSEPWGNEEFGGAVSFAPGAPSPLNAFVDRYAGRLAGTPAARQALATIFNAALADIAPPTLPAAVRAAYATLDREIGLGSGHEGARPGDDREPFDAERLYRAAEDDAVSFGGFGLGGLLTPLRVLSFWKMKDRARQFGESGGNALLRDLQSVLPPDREVRFHLMGHSFGCIAVSATAAGAPGSAPLPRPVHSIVLVQGAFSLWAYCAVIPSAPGQPGYFHRLVADGGIAGPIVTTQSRFDTAVGRFYPLGAGAARQVSFDPTALPRYGAVGAFGLQGPGLSVVNQALLAADAPYAFAGGTIYNLDSNGVIRQGGPPSGAHGDFQHPEVAHAVWSAAWS